MRAGAARIDVTPDYPTDLGGFFVRIQPAEGIADRIWARAAVFDNGRTRLVLASLELVEIPRAIADSLRADLADLLKTTPEHVCIACTHTHAAPCIYALRECGRPSQRYARELGERLLKCAREAEADMVKVRLGSATAPLRIGLNRRAASRADRGGPTGDQPADQTLRVLTATDERGRLRLALLNYACHGVCLMGDNRRISGDYAGLGCSELEHRAGDGSVFLFLQGPAGDINPRPEFHGSYESARRAGMLLADAASPLLKHGVLIGDDSLSAEYRIEPLAFEPPDEEAWRRRMRELDRRIEHLDDNRPKGDAGWLRAGREYYADLITRARRGEYPAHMDVVLQPLRIGPVEIVALSGEMFYELGQQVREQSGQPDLWIASYCNGGEGYIPTQAAYAEGSYEVDNSHWFYDRPALVPGEGERLAGAAAAWLLRSDMPTR
jgi:neutral ceramidase